MRGWKGERLRARDELGQLHCSRRDFRFTTFEPHHPHASSEAGHAARVRVTRLQSYEPEVSAVMGRMYKTARTRVWSAYIRQSGLESGPKGELFRARDEHCQLHCSRVGPKF